MLEGGQAWAWTSPTSIAVFAAGAALLVAFALVERRAAEPVLPLWVLRRRLLATTTLLSLGVGVILIGLTAYVPTYLTNALGVSPVVAGLALAALVMGWPLAASLSGRLFYLRLGFRPTILIGLGLVVVGTAGLALLARTPSVAAVAITCFVTGMGMGLVATPSLIAAQASVGWAERGVATGTNMFARSLGSAVGAAVLGAVANGVIAASGRPETDPAAATAAGVAVFVAVLVAALLTVGAGLWMPKVEAPARGLGGLLPGVRRGRHPEPGHPPALHRDDGEHVVERVTASPTAGIRPRLCTTKPPRVSYGPGGSAMPVRPASSSRCSRPSNSLAVGGRRRGRTRPRSRRRAPR